MTYEELHAHPIFNSEMAHKCVAANKTCEHCGFTDDSVKLQTRERKWWARHTVMLVKRKMMIIAGVYKSISDVWISSHLLVS